jgi:hypothetical protein
MALKKETKQTSYTSRISVNRGAGFSSLANAYKSQSDAFDQLTNAYASTMLDEIQTRGKKIGKEAAENVKFALDENGNRVPVETFKPRTRSEQEVYERDLANRYILEATKQGKQIVAESALNAKNNNLSHQSFDEDVTAKLDALYGSLPDNVRYLTETYVEDARHQSWLNVMQTYTARQKAINLKNDEADIDILLGSALAGNLSPEEIQEELSLYKSGDYYTNNSKDIERNLAGAIGFGQLKSKLFPKPINEMTPNELQNALNDAIALEEALSGRDGGVTSSGVNLTSEYVYGLLPDGVIRNNAKQNMNAYASNLNIVLSDKMITGSMGPIIDNVLDTGNTGLLAGAEENDIIDYLDTNALPEKLQTIYPFNIANPDDPNNAMYMPNPNGEGYVINPQSVSYAAATIKTTGKLSTYWENKLNNEIMANVNNTMSDVEASGLLDAMFNDTDVKYIKNQDSTVTVRVFTRDNFANINLDASTKMKLKVMHTLYNSGKDTEEIIDYFKDVDKLGTLNYTDQQLVEMTGRYKTFNELTEKANTIMNDVFDDISLDDAKAFNPFLQDLELSKIKNMRASLNLTGKVKEHIRNYIRAGGQLRKDAELEQLVTNYVNGLLYGPTTEYGISVWNWNQDGFSPFVGEDDVLTPNTYSVSLYPLEKTAMVNGKANWIENVIYEKIRGSADYNNEKDLSMKTDGGLGKNKYTLGNIVRVEPIDDTEPVLYNILYDNNGVITQYKDEDGFPLVLDIELEKQRFKNRFSNQPRGSDM